MYRTSLLPFVVVLMCGVLHPAAAQTIRGQVVDSITLTPLAASGVALIDESGSEVGSTRTDLSGLFLLRAPLPGRYHLRVEQQGYRTSDFPPFQVAADQLLGYVLLVAPLSGSSDNPEPGSDEIVAQVCPAGAPHGLPVIVGVVREGVTQQPVAGAHVRATTQVVPDVLRRWVSPDGSYASVSVESNPDGSYAVCGAPLGSRIDIHAALGDRSSRFVALLFLNEGVSTGATFYKMDTRVWWQDFDLLGPAHQTAALTGQVVDNADVPVAHAEVSIIGSQYRTRTDASGRFSLAALPPGFVRILVRRLGFSPIERDVQLVGRVTVDLSAHGLVARNAPVRLDKVTITAEAPPRNPGMVGFSTRRERSTRGEFLTMREYEGRRGAPTRATELLMSLQGITPRIRVVTAGLAHAAVSFSRCLGKPPAYYVDGLLIGTGADTDIDAILSTQWIEAVEAYHDATFVVIGRAPPRGSCGAIYFWTSRR